MRRPPSCSTSDGSRTGILAARSSAPSLVCHPQLSLSVAQLRNYSTVQLPPHACGADLASAFGMPAAQDIKARGWQMNAPLWVRQALFPPFWALPAGCGGAGCQIFHNYLASLLMEQALCCRCA